MCVTGRQLIAEGYLSEIPIQNSYGFKVVLSSKAHCWLCGDKKLSLAPTMEMVMLDKRPTTPTLAPVILPDGEVASSYVCKPELHHTAAPPMLQPIKDPATEEKEAVIYQRLLSLRNDIAMENDVAPYMVASNMLLKQLVISRPSTLPNMVRVEGVSQQWCNQFGSRVLAKLTSCYNNYPDLSLDNFLNKQAVLKAGPVMVRMRKEIINQLTFTMETSYQMFQMEGLSLEETAKRRSLHPSTIGGHISEALYNGYHVDYRRAGLSEELECRIIAAIRAAPINSNVASVGAIKEQLPAEVDYWHIKMTISLLQVSTNYRRPADNKSPSNSMPYIKRINSNKRQLPKWPVKKETKKSKKFF